MFDMIVEEIKAERRAKRRGIVAPVVERLPAYTGPVAVHETWFCKAPACRTWVSRGAHLRGVCNHCGTPKGATAPLAAN